MEGLIQEQMEDEGPDENNPAFRSAVTLAMQALYKSNAAADVAKALRSAPTPVEGLANTAYDIAALVDEQTNGEVPDELIVLLGVTILQEVAEIGEAAGVDVSPQNVAEAFKQMLLRFLGEQGLDTTQLQQAMEEVDPAVFNKAAEAEV